MQTPKAILLKFFEHILYTNAGGCCKPEEDMLVITREPHLSLGVLEPHLSLGVSRKCLLGTPPSSPPSLRAYTFLRFAVVCANERMV